MIVQLVKLEVDPEQARLYQEFCKNYDMFKILVDSGVFETKSSSATLHFDLNGVLMTVTKPNVKFPDHIVYQRFDKK